VFLLLLLEGGLLSFGGAALGLVFSRVGLLILAQLIQDKFRYDWNSIGVLPSEWALFGVAIFVGLMAAAIPGFSALKIDISPTLSEK
jgi:ABC-type antimicrobial peptide transport system permease subunit